MNLKDYKNLHFIGIGGISMSALAEILLCEGYKISGSEIRSTDTTEKLEKKGIKVYIGQISENISSNIDLVIYTSAVKEDNEELKKVIEEGIACIERSELLGAMMKDYEKSISIAGTHGKTTTTSMVSEVFLEAGKDPTIMIGGILPTIDGNFKVGKKEYFIVESCEYCDSFLKFNPHSAIILNVDRDHIDYFSTMDQIYSSFRKFSGLVPDSGVVVINKDIPDFEKIVDGVTCKVTTYGAESNCEWYPKNVRYNEYGYATYDIMNNDEKVIEISLNVPGFHNVLNSLGVFLLARFYGIEDDVIRRGLYNFTGTNRRFQLKGTFNDTTVIDDYAHHPTEIKATLNGAKKIQMNELWCLFQPHTYSRTKALIDEFADSFELADHIVILDIYASREKDNGNIHSKDLVEKIKAKGKDVYYKDSFESATEFLLNNCKQNDVLITLGAGDVYLVGEMLVK